jgi:hypothetical protein
MFCNSVYLLIKSFRYVKGLCLYPSDLQDSVVVFFAVQVQVVDEERKVLDD